MLSRTAEGLFWMGRYIERMENVARLLEAGRRLEGLPRKPSQEHNEWGSVLTASGATGTFSGEAEDADADSVSEHLIRSLDNPSSIASCIEAARMNAKAVRNAITGEVWEAINDTRAELRVRLDKKQDQNNFSDFLDWVRMRGGLVLGKMENTLLRDDGFCFIQLGKWFERADATARLLDVKFHVLLPDAKDVGGGLDYLQWHQILRATNSAVAFRHLYSRIVDPRGVVDLLVLNEKSPRSLLTATAMISATLDKVVSDLPVQQQMARDMRARAAELRATTVDEIFDRGLHDWLTEFIAETNTKANETSQAFGFGYNTFQDSNDVTQ